MKFFNVDDELGLKTYISNRVAWHRTLLGLTQSQLASRVGVSKNAISSIERGEYYPSLVVAFALSVELKIPVEDLFFYTLTDGEKSYNVSVTELRVML